MKLDLRQLRHVLALDHHRNFARAAEAIGLTQPALSRSLQSLEDEIGAKLFDRDRARVEPTAVGARLIELARPLIAQAKFAERELEQMIGLAGGLLRIGAGPYAAETCVGTAVGRLIRQYPDIMVDVSVGDWPELYRRLLSDELDVVIAETSHAMDDDRLVLEALPEHHGVFYCRSGHPLTSQAKLTLQDVGSFPVAMTAVPRRMVELAGRGDSTARTDLPEGASTTEIRVDTPYLARKIVLESDAIGVTMPRQIDHEVALGRLVVLPLHVPWLKSNYGVIRLARRTPAPGAIEFLRILHEVEDEIVAETAAVPAGAVAPV